MVMQFFRSPLLQVVVLALAIRLPMAIGIQVLLDDHWHREFVVEGDANGYWALGQAISRGDRYEVYEPPRRVHRMPGFPLFLSMFAVFVGDCHLAPRIGNAVIGSLACGAVTVLAGNWLTRSGARLAGVLCAASPLLVGFSVILLSETLFVLLLMLSLLCMARSRIANQTDSSSSSDWLWVILAGLSSGLATLVRPSWILFPMVVVGWFCLPGRFSPRRLRLAVVMAGCSVAPLAPWVIRNAEVTGQFVLTTLWTGPTLYDSLNPDADGSSDMSFLESDPDSRTLNEVALNQKYTRLAWSFLADQPVRVAQLAFWKQVRFWNPVPQAAELSHPVLRWGVAVWSGPFLLAAMLGMWRMRKEREFQVLVIGPVVYTAALHLLFVGSIRYRVPVEYLLAVAAAVLLIPLLDRKTESAAESVPTS